MLGFDELIVAMMFQLPYVLSFRDNVYLIINSPLTLLPNPLCPCLILRVKTTFQFPYHLPGLVIPINIKPRICVSNKDGELNYIEDKLISSLFFLIY